MHKNSMAVVFLILSGIPVNSQEVEWMTGFDGFLDNREYDVIDNSYTVFGSRVRAGFGFSLDESHRMEFGLNYLYEFGYTLNAHLPDPTLYYQYSSRGIDFRLGAFPRRRIIDYPLAMLSDTLLYYRPNVEGAYLGYHGRWGFQDVFIDWTSRQTDVRYERFVFGFSGRINLDFFFVRHHAVMGHFAGRGLPDPDHHLRDNGGFDVDIGADLAQLGLIDSLSLSFGTLVSLDRIRGVHDSWQMPAGMVGRFSVFHGGLGISGLYYRGQGHPFLYGDPFFRLKEYGKIDLTYMPFRDKNIRVRFNVGVHFAEGRIDYSQQILVSAAIGGSRPVRNAPSQSSSRIHQE